MYPPVLSDASILPEKNTIVILGVEGQAPLKYLQFCSDSLTCSNFRFEAISNDVIALAVKVPVKNMNINSYTVSKKATGYIGSAAFGFRSVDDDEVSINKVGVFYYGTLNTDTSAFDPTIDYQKVSLAYEKYPNLLTGKSPINFNAPNSE